MATGQTTSARADGQLEPDAARYEERRRETERILQAEVEASTSPRLSNTGGLNRKIRPIGTEQPTCQTAGLDWLSWCAYGRQTRWEWLRAELVRLRDQKILHPQQPAVLDTELGCFEVQGGLTGIGNVWTISTQFCKVGIYDRESWDGKSKPSVYCVLSGIPLAIYGLEKSLWIIEQMLEGIGLKVDFHNRAADMHLKVDQAGTHPIQYYIPVKQEKYVTKAGGKPQHREEDDPYQTDIGARDSVAMQIYDKAKELRDQRHKPGGWEKLCAMSEALGMTPGILPMNLTRIEFRVKGSSSFMKAFKCETLGDSLRAVPAISKKLFTRWFRLLDEPNKKDGNESRAKLHKLWEHAMSEAENTFGQHFGPVPTKVERKQPGDHKHRQKTFLSMTAKDCVETANKRPDLEALKLHFCRAVDENAEDVLDMLDKGWAVEEINRGEGMREYEERDVAGHAAQAQDRWEDHLNGLGKKPD